MKNPFGNRNPENLKKGDVVELTQDITTSSYSFKAGERMVVTWVGLTCVDLEDENDKTKWVTDVSFREVKRVQSR